MLVLGAVVVEAGLEQAQREFEFRMPTPRLDPTGVPSVERFGLERAGDEFGQVGEQGVAEVGEDFEFRPVADELGGAGLPVGGGAEGEEGAAQNLLTIIDLIERVVIFEPPDRPRPEGIGNGHAYSATGITDDPSDTTHSFAWQKIDDGKLHRGSLRATPEALARSELLTPPLLDALLKRDAGVHCLNTDRNRWLEFHSPKYHLDRRDHRTASLRCLESAKEPAASPAP